MVIPPESYWHALDLEPWCCWLFGSLALLAVAWIEVLRCAAAVCRGPAPSSHPGRRQLAPTPLTARSNEIIQPEAWSACWCSPLRWSWDGPLGASFLGVEHGFDVELVSSDRAWRTSARM